MSFDWTHTNPDAEAISSGSATQGSGTETPAALLARIERYWRDLSVNGTVPYRHDVSPRDIGSCLRYTFLATVIAPGLARLRYAGQDVSGLFGMDVRGMPLSALFEADGRDRLRDGITRMAEGPTLVELPLSVPGGLWRRPIPGRLSLLPLRDETGVVNHILGAVVFATPVPGRSGLQLAVPTERPSRFESLRQTATPRPAIAPKPAEPLRLERRAKPFDLGIGAPRAAAPTRAETEAPFTPRPGRARLRLVVDNT